MKFSAARGIITRQVVYTRGVAIHYREISWQDLEKPSGLKRILPTEIYGWLIAGLLFFSMMLMLAPVQEMFFSDEELQAIYLRSHDWLNRCDQVCEQVVDVAMLAETSNCDRLQEMFTQPRPLDPREWKLAIDDRATSLGCSSFPKSLAFINETVLHAAAEEQEQIEEVTEQRAEGQEQRDSDVVQKFMSGVQQAGLHEYIRQATVRDGNEYLLEVVLNEPAWEKVFNNRRQQYVHVMWSKWVNAKSPRNHQLPKIRLYNIIGEEMGGSVDHELGKVWVRLR